MGNAVKGTDNVIQAFWFRIQYANGRQFGRRSEVVVYTGNSLSEVMDRIAKAQIGRLAYDPQSPRITRIAALRAPPPAIDPGFFRMLDETLVLENNQAIRTV
jgi:hypothetical protein